MHNSTILMTWLHTWSTCNAESRSHQNLKTIKKIKEIEGYYFNHNVCMNWKRITSRMPLVLYLKSGRWPSFNTLSHKRYVDRRIITYQILMILYGVQQKMKADMMTSVILTVLILARLNVPPVMRRIPSSRLTAHQCRMWTQHLLQRLLPTSWHVTNLLESGGRSRPEWTRKWKWKRPTVERTSSSSQKRRRRFHGLELGTN